jgi:hypothetical protein
MTKMNKKATDAVPNLEPKAALSLTPTEIIAETAIAGSIDADGEFTKKWIPAWSEGHEDIVNFPNIDFIDAEAAKDPKIEARDFSELNEAVKSEQYDNTIDLELKTTEVTRDILSLMHGFQNTATQDLFETVYMDSEHSVEYVDGEGEPDNGKAYSEAEDEDKIHVRTVGNIDGDAGETPIPVYKNILPQIIIKPLGTKSKYVVNMEKLLSSDTNEITKFVANKLIVNSDFTEGFRPQGLTGYSYFLRSGENKVSLVNGDVVSNISLDDKIIDASNTITYDIEGPKVKSNLVVKHHANVELSEQRLKNGEGEDIQLYFPKESTDTHTFYFMLEGVKYSLSFIRPEGTYALNLIRYDAEDNPTIIKGPDDTSSYVFPEDTSSWDDIYIWKRGQHALNNVELEIPAFGILTFDKELVECKVSEDLEAMGDYIYGPSKNIQLDLAANFNGPLHAPFVHKYSHDDDGEYTISLVNGEHIVSSGTTPIVKYVQQFILTNTTTNVQIAKYNLSGVLNEPTVYSNNITDNMVITLGKFTFTVKLKTDASKMLVTGPSPLIKLPVSKERLISTDNVIDDTKKIMLEKNDPVQFFKYDPAGELDGHCYVLKASVKKIKLDVVQPLIKIPLVYVTSSRIFYNIKGTILNFKFPGQFEQEANEEENILASSASNYLSGLNFINPKEGFYNFYSATTSEEKVMNPLDDTKKIADKWSFDLNKYENTYTTTPPVKNDIVKGGDDVIIKYGFALLAPGTTTGLLLPQLKGGSLFNEPSADDEARNVVFNVSSADIMAKAFHLDQTDVDPKDDWPDSLDHFKSGIMFSAVNKTNSIDPEVPNIFTAEEAMIMSITRGILSEMTKFVKDSQIQTNKNNIEIIMKDYLKEIIIPAISSLKSSVADLSKYATSINYVVYQLYTRQVRMINAINRNKELINGNAAMIQNTREMLGIKDTDHSSVEVITHLNATNSDFNKNNDVTFAHDVTKLSVTMIGKTVIVNGVITLTNALAIDPSSTAYPLISGLPIPADVTTNTIAAATLAEILSTSVNPLASNIPDPLLAAASPAPTVVSGVVSVDPGGLLRLSIPPRLISTIQGGSIVINQLTYVTA